MALETVALGTKAAVAAHKMDKARTTGVPMTTDEKVLMFGGLAVGAYLILHKSNTAQADNSGAAPGAATVNGSTPDNSGSGNQSSMGSGGGDSGLNGTGTGGGGDNSGVTVTNPTGSSAVVTVQAPDGKVYSGTDYKQVVNQAGGMNVNGNWVPGHYVGNTFVPLPVPPVKPTSIRTPSGQLVKGNSYIATVNAAGGYWHLGKWVAGHYVGSRFVASPVAPKKAPGSQRSQRPAAAKSSQPHVTKPTKPAQVTHSTVPSSHQLPKVQLHAPANSPSKQIIVKHTAPQAAQQPQQPHAPNLVQGRPVAQRPVIPVRSTRPAPAVPMPQAHAMNLMQAQHLQPSIQPRPVAQTPLARAMSLPQTPVRKPAPVTMRQRVTRSVRPVQPPKKKVPARVGLRTPNGF